MTTRAALGDPKGKLQSSAAPRRASKSAASGPGGVSQPAADQAGAKPAAGR